MPHRLYRSFSDARYSIHQYFDGKCTDDEILYHADISRRQLREVLHHYDEYVSLFFHSSIPTFLFRVTPCALSTARHPSTPPMARSPHHHPSGLGPLFHYRLTRHLPPFNFNPSFAPSLPITAWAQPVLASTATGSIVFFLLVRTDRFSHVHLCMFVFPFTVTVVPASVLA